MQRLICVILIWASATALARAGDESSKVRFWTDNTGDFTVRATLAELDKKSVSLRLSNGELIDVPLNRLSAADHVWLRTQTVAQQPRATEVGGIKWFKKLKDAQATAVGSETANDTKPILCFRALGDLCGFM